VDWLIDFFASFFDLLTSLFVAVLSPVFKVLGYLVYWICDGILYSFWLYLSTLDMSAVAFDWAARWAGLPPQLVYLVTAVGLPQCLLIISEAILVRFLINLIPAEFTRI
jgi:hypothetical protein